jgi:hypothetical protein
MTMAEPVVIVHGVANHDSASFHNNVDRLQRQIGSAWRLIPVDWGELGGQSADITDCLPVYDGDGWHVRSKPGNAPIPDEAMVRAVIGQGELDNSQRADIVAAGVRGTDSLRSPNTESSTQVKEAVERELASTTVLKHIDDPQALAAVGETIRSVLDNLPTASALSTEGGEFAIRSEGVDIRSILDPVKTVAASVLHGIDDVLGRVLGDQVGRLTQNLRGRLAVPLSGFFGDILVYQRQPDRIQARLRETLEREAAGYGRKDKPVHVIAHSLGGVIAFDAAVHPESEEKRLWMKSFLTFGSQAAFFHIIDPRQPSLPIYARGAPVTLPSSIGRWINLWDTLDVLAFTAGTVFRLADGSRPIDIPVQDPASLLIKDKGWAHSIYWQTEELQKALRDSLAER